MKKLCQIKKSNNISERSENLLFLVEYGNRVVLVIAQYPVDLLCVMKPEPTYKCRVAFYMPPV